ncbi:MAG: hypothetical protein DRJ29_16495 [Bacteroidetes bacterium]|nr:MAG: hypothetical protein DRJ29_16495 [Bacteroidota bacterium]
MLLKRTLYLSVFLIVSVAGQAQINVYLGGNIQGNYSWIRGDEPTKEPGFGAGVSFVYWEYEYWFLKAGIDYTRKTSTVLEYPDDYGVEPENSDDKINITYTEQSIGIPLTVYFRPWEQGPNSILLSGTLNTIIVANLKLNSEEYGELVKKGTDVKTRLKSNVGIGVGYQRQLDKHKFLNIIPSYNIDLRGDPAFNSITLTVEFIFGIY